MNQLRCFARTFAAVISVTAAAAMASCTTAQTDDDTALGDSTDGTGSSGDAGANQTATGGGSVSGGSGTAGTTTGGFTTGGLTSSGGTTSGSTNGGNTTTGVTTSTGTTSGATTSSSTTTSGSTTSTGGTTGRTTTGGTTGTTGSCTDTPPPNGDTCAHAVQYGWCSQGWLNGACAASCGMCSASNTTGGSTTGGSTTGGNTSSSSTTGGSTTGSTTSTSGGMQPPPIQGGSNGWASRYWDCCKPACGWKANVHSGNPMQSCNRQDQSLGGSYDVQNACEGNENGAYMCWNAAPWSVSDTLSYGFVAASGGNYVCGRCYQIQFSGSGHSGNNPGAVSLNGKTMIVQVINNGGVAQDQFDLLIPGGGVGALNACTTQWGTSDLGAQYGGFLAGCNGDTNCVKQKCQTVFGDKPDLLAGCNWFLGWFNAADNPNFVYKQIACPAAITQKSGMQDPG